MNAAELRALAGALKSKALSLGFSQVGVSRPNLAADERHLMDWLARNYHGEMDWMARHPGRRSRPHELVPGTLRIISVTLNYWPREAAPAEALLETPERGYISRYALGRDYHRIMRPRLATLGRWLMETATARHPAPQRGVEADPSHTRPMRPFVDSAPLLERAIGRDAGLGFIGKHTNLIHPDEGSWFFIGELVTDLPLPTDPPFLGQHCGSCQDCIDICPTQAIVAPYQLDARRCISYLTIEYDGIIPEPLRRPIGNRIFGCDDCQLVCPWNRHAQPSLEPDLGPRHGLDAPSLETLWRWDETSFLAHTEGSPLRRMGYQKFRRNLAVALGNGLRERGAYGDADSEAWVQRVRVALQAARPSASALLAPHIDWALAQ